MVIGDLGGVGVGVDGSGDTAFSGTFAGSFSFAGAVAGASGAGEVAAGGEEAAGNVESGVSSWMALALRKDKL